MIRLFDVSLSLRDKEVGALPILRNVSIALPANRRVVILGQDYRALSEVLLMLAGMRKPDRGWIDQDRMRCAPVVNSASLTGRTLVPQLSALENIRLAAATHGIDEYALLALVESACQFGKLLAAPTASLDRTMKRKLEAALIAAIPFDCYYIDRLHEFEGPLIWQFVHVAAKRGAGILFTSRMPNQTRKFAELAAILEDESIEVCHDVSEVLSGDGS